MPRRKYYNIEEEAKKWFLVAQKANQKSYEYGLSTLYKMCNKKPWHGQPNDVISKLWLIGRSHSAALERTNDKSSGTTMDIYKNTANKIIFYRDTLDRLIKNIQRNPPHLQYGPDHLNAIYKAVEFLVNIFYKTTGERKISLASKYLHFHEPQIPIYDSISSGALKWFNAENKPSGSEKLLWRRSKYRNYGKHLVRYGWLFKELKKGPYKSRLSARSIDIFLLHWSD